MSWVEDRFKELSSTHGQHTTGVLIAELLSKILEQMRASGSSSASGQPVKLADAVSKAGTNEKPPSGVMGVAAASPLGEPGSFKFSAADMQAKMAAMDSGEQPLIS